MSNVLVADDDLWILRMIATVLERRGHSVTLASDGEEALAQALRTAPDLVITDINMPRMDGWDLISALRNKDELADIPIIVLSEAADDDSRVRGFRLGIEDYIAKPFRFEELDLRVARIMKRAPSEADGPRRLETDSGAVASMGLVGTLDQVALSSLLTLLELDRKTGVLSLSRDGNGGEAELARISITAGRCHAAEWVGREAPVDAECIYELLGWSAGRFEFNQQPVTVEDRIGQSTTSLLMEAARLADEANR